MGETLLINHNQTLLGTTKIRDALKPFDVEFGPLIAEIDAKQKVIRECADSTTMVRIKRKYIVQAVRFRILALCQALVRNL